MGDGMEENVLDDLECDIGDGDSKERQPPREKFHIVIFERGKTRDATRREFTGSLSS
jgi:hypothetical protein